MEELQCPSCRGEQIDSVRLVLENFDENFDLDADCSSDEDDLASKAPKPLEMWPPFGCGATQKAIEMLGEECWKISDKYVMKGATMETSSEQLAEFGWERVGTAGTMPQAPKHSEDRLPQLASIDYGIITNNVHVVTKEATRHDEARDGEGLILNGSVAQNADPWGSLQSSIQVPSSVEKNTSRKLALETGKLQSGSTWDSVQQSI